MFRYIRKHYVLALLALCASVIAQIAAPVSAIMEQNMIDFIVQGDMEGFLQILWYVAFFVAATGLAYYLRALLENRFRAAFAEDLRNDLYDGMMRKGRSSFDEQDTAEYISVINNDVDTVSSNFTSPIWALAGTAVSTMVTMVIMVIYSPILAGLAVICSLISFLIPMVITKHLKKRLVEKTIYEAGLSFQLKEALNGHEVISAFHAFPQIRSRFIAANKTLTNSLYKFTLLISGLENSSVVIGKVTKFVTFLVAGGDGY